VPPMPHRSYAPEECHPSSLALKTVKSATCVYNQEHIQWKQ